MIESYRVVRDALDLGTFYLVRDSGEEVEVLFTGSYAQCCLAKVESESGIV